LVHLPQGLHSIALPPSKESHSKITKINPIQANYTCTLQEPSASCTKQPMNPTEVAEPIQNPTTQLQITNPMQFVAKPHNYKPQASLFATKQRNSLKDHQDQSNPSQLHLHPARTLCTMQKTTPEPYISYKTLLHNYKLQTLCNL